MRYASKFDQFCHELVVFAREYWLIAVLGAAAAILFLQLICWYAP